MVMVIVTVSSFSQTKQIDNQDGNSDDGYQTNMIFYHSIKDGKDCAGCIIEGGLCTDDGSIDCLEISN